MDPLDRRRRLRRHPRSPTPPSTPPTVYIGSVDHNLYALDADSGDTIWTAGVGGFISGSASVIDDVVYASDSDNQRTYGWAVDDGHVVYEVDKGQYNPVISDGRRIYLTGYAGITKLTPKQEGAGPGKGGAKKNQPKHKGGGKKKPEHKGGGGGHRGGGDHNKDHKKHKNRHRKPHGGGGTN